MPCFYRRDWFGICLSEKKHEKGKAAILPVPESGGIDAQ